MHDIANMNANLQFDLLIRCHIGIPFGERPLNFNRALRCFQRAVELD